MKAFDEVLSAAFNGAEPDITEENLQARIRGNLVMALSNKFGWLVLTTGNKSEMSVGYATLYGDMAGGFAVLKDVFKGDRLPAGALAQRARGPRARARARCWSGRPRPSCATSSATRTRCRPTTCSTRSWRATSSRTSMPTSSSRQGLPREDVERVIRLVDLAEYKRRQAPPGVRVSTKAFGRDRRLPITNRFRGG